MFMIKLVCKPFAKFLIKHPLIAGVFLTTLYLYIGYRCLLTAWEYNYRKSATKDEIAARWQQTMAYTKRD